MAPLDLAPSEQSSFLFGANATFIAELYARYRQDPASVDGSWQGFFAQLGDDGREILAELNGASWAKTGAAVIGAPDPDAVPAKPEKGAEKKAKDAAPAAASAPARPPPACRPSRCARRRWTASVP
ncbi:MAG: 2-oxoglutarate dehydrogenase component [Pseudomonadota bacterium]|jgi:2-oxoglutarate dehydrogenase E1 component